ncbi:Nucleolin [Tupaia chinensis]|uniref:Nucleolin n=1 Tax=Tupaia chinensis TaxID=246437 RepID=L9L8B2_TUPCH|nr:Nucleolin [Tupaia chinensis]
MANLKGLSEDATEETLNESFNGSICERIVIDWETGSSKEFSFVDFNSEKDGRSWKEAMEDGEIDGNNVPWNGPSARVKVASGFMVEAEEAWKAVMVAENEMDLVAEVEEALESEMASEEAQEEEETSATRKEDEV